LQNAPVDEMFGEGIHKTEYLPKDLAFEVDNRT
jgi:hypothetical protein